MAACFPGCAIALSNLDFRIPLNKVYHIKQHKSNLRERLHTVPGSMFHVRGLEHKLMYVLQNMTNLGDRGRRYLGDRVPRTRNREVHVLGISVSPWFPFCLVRVIRVIRGPIFSVLVAAIPPLSPRGFIFSGPSCVEESHTGPVSI